MTVGGLRIRRERRCALLEISGGQLRLQAPAGFRVCRSQLLQAFLDILRTVQTAGAANHVVQPLGVRLAAWQIEKTKPFIRRPVTVRKISRNAEFEPRPIQHRPRQVRNRQFQLPDGQRARLAVQQTHRPIQTRHGRQSGQARGIVRRLGRFGRRRELRQQPCIMHPLPRRIPRRGVSPGQQQFSLRFV